MTSKRKIAAAALCGLTAVLLAAQSFAAYRDLAAKFDKSKPMTFTGIVTSVNWKNPQVHLFVNVKNDEGRLENWAVELPNTIALQKSGWSPDSVRPGDAIRVQGILARDGSRQIWGDKVEMAASGKPILFVRDTAPIPPQQARPTPRWPDGVPMLGAQDASGGYWGYPTETALVQDGVHVDMDAEGLLANLSDASKVAPFQPWALALYQNRQQRHLRDDPTFLKCEPPAGPREFESDLGVSFIADRARQRIFVLMGSGDRNYRLLYLDGRKPIGQVGGDDNNPLFYGRSVGKWEGDTLVIQTTDFNTDFWMTNGGLPHTNMLHLTERFSRPNYDTLHYEVTIDDPGAYTKPWTASWDLHWVGGEDLPVYFCQDNRP